MKLFKRILVVLLILVGIGVGSVFVAFTFYKKELTSILIEDLKVKYGLKLTVEEVRISLIQNWPHTSINLKNVSVSSELSREKNSVFLKAGSLAISFNLQKLLHKQFVIRNIALQDVDLNLIKYADGSKNFEIKKQTDTIHIKSGLSLNLDKISLKNVNFNFKNEIRGQDIGFKFIDNVIRLKNYEEGIGAKIQGEVRIKGLLLNPDAGEFLTNTNASLNLDVAYLFKEKSICVYPPSNAEIEGHRYNLTSIIDLSDKKTLSLVIESKAVESAMVAKYLTPKIKKVLANFTVKRALDAKVMIVAHLGVRENPIIIADIVGKDCDLTIGQSKIPYSHVYFKGRVLSMHASRQRGDMQHAKISFESIKGNLYAFPFEASLNVRDLPKPMIDINASLVIDGKNIKEDIAKRFTIRGTALATIKYSANARNLNKQKFLSDSMNLYAYLLFNNLTYKKVGESMEYILNGKATIDKRNLNFEKLHLKTSIGEFLLKGRVEQFLKFILGMTNDLKANVDARSELINLNPLLSKATEDPGVGSKRKIKSHYLKESQFDFKINISATKLLLRKIVTQNAQIDLEYRNKLLNISRFRVNTCEGEIKASGKIRDFKKIETKVSIKDVDATKLFEQFENFGQEAIKSENIRGKVFLEATLSAELDQNNEFKGESMKADANVILKDGHLLNFEPLQNISNFVMKQRDVKDVSFSEIDETFKVRGFEMKIDELEIASSILNLYIVNGLYCMKGNSNINMLIPWSNLKRLGWNAAPKGSGESAENTKGLKLNYSGPPKKLKLSFGHKEQEKRFW